LIGARRSAAAAGKIFPVAEAGGEMSKTLVDAAESISDQGDQLQGEPFSAHLRHHGPAQPLDEGGETLGGGAGRNRHAGLLV
jgi:hypothetical protein